ncbi:MAG: hypothetical protein GX432_11190 [Candidatus Atribacteria bacterium]|nr:hypothetical protein [Candidatus Atribacteria bacterium]
MNSFLHRGGFREVCLSLYCLITFTRSCIFKIDRHTTYVAPDDNENPRFDMPWHISYLKIKLLGDELSCPFLFRHCEESNRSLVG